jgi:hypothetical protein
MRIELMCCEAVLLQEIANKRFKRNDIALTYYLAMRSGERVDWATVNRAIMDRWSESALRYIKTRAWKLRDEACDREMRLEREEG